MTGTNDQRYFSRRAGEEDQAAQQATSELARHRHQELARLYRLRAAGAFRDRDASELNADCEAA